MRVFGCTRFLKLAGVPQGSELRGKVLSGYVLAEAQDGYQVLFSLGELDPAFIDDEILLADAANGKPLFGAQGRFRPVWFRRTSQVPDRSESW